MPRSLPIFAVSSSLLLAVHAWGVDPGTANSQVEQARQFGSTYPPAATGETAVTPTSVAPSLANPDDDSFGDQEVLKRVDRTPTYLLFGDYSGFYTNNVALTRTGARGDWFMAGDFGLTGAKNLTPDLQGSFTAKVGVFRYDRFTAFDLWSFDLGGGLTYRVHPLWDISVFGYYDFTDLYNGNSGQEFFNNHSFDFGFQKTWALNRAVAVQAGFSADFNLSNPGTLQRDDLSPFVGLHVDITHLLSADLSYRYAYQIYDKTSRADNNNNVSLSLRYAVNRWFSLNGSVYYTFNRSNESVFSYDAVASGVGFGATIRF